MRFIATFLTTRATQPDPASVRAAVRAACGDPEAEAGGTFPMYAAVKSTAWTAGEIAAAQAAIDGAPDLTPQRQAQNEIDQLSIAFRALVLALVDQINVLRQEIVELRQATGLPQTPPLLDVTPVQALAAIRSKAATL